MDNMITIIVEYWKIFSSHTSHSIEYRAYAATLLPAVPHYIM